MYQFGVGALFAKFPDGTSVEFGTLQDCNIDFSFDKKELYGRQQFPVKVARAKGKVDGKATYADIKAEALNLVLNGTITAGELKVAEPVNTTVPSTHTVAITVPVGGTLNQVLKVYDVSGSTKVPMTPVSTSPTVAGTYYVDNGSIEFASADEDLKVQYQFDYTVTSGKTVEIKNAMMGTSPVFEAEFYAALDGVPITVVLNNCTSEKLTLNFKNEDFTIPDFTFSAFSDAADVVGYIYLSE
jgi:hypothetical protein